MNSFFKYLKNRIKEPTTYLATGMAVIGGQAGLEALANSGDRGTLIATLLTTFLGVFLPENKKNK